MKRQNGVILDGVLARLGDARSLGEAAGEDALLGTLVSDPHLGSAGRHAVLFQARLAAEVRAFARAAHAAAPGAPLEVTVWGYLLGATVVVADRVSFHVPNAVRVAAGVELKERRNGPAEQRVR